MLAERFNRNYEASCDAQITTNTVQRAVYRKGLTFEGRPFDLGPEVIDSPGIEEATASCSFEACNLLKVLTAEGEGPFGALNAVRSEIAAYITENCGKWKQEVEKGHVSGKMPTSKVPR